MANFYPTIDAGFHASEGEKLVYKALQKLNNEYRVIHSYRWLGDDSQRRSEGEADFLIISGEGDFVCDREGSFYRKQLDFSAWHVIIYLSLNAPCSGT